jgi:hypothetical protein
MVKIGVTVRGFREMEDKNYKRSARLEDLRWLAAGFEKYIMGKRMRSMWDHQGQISGRYGEGSKKWARNSDWVAGVKGFNKPLFGSPGRSRIESSYQFTKWYQRRHGSRYGRGESRRLKPRVDLRVCEVRRPRDQRGVGEVGRIRERLL